MPYTTRFFIHTAGGGIGGSGSSAVDQWRVSMKITAPIGETVNPAELTAFLNAMVVPWETFHENTSVTAGSMFQLEQLTIALVGTDGLYVSGALQETTRLAVGPFQGAGAANQPWATACVYTLRTLRARGAGSVGRFFYPAAGGAPASDGLWSSSQTASRASAAATLLNAVNAQAVAALDPSSQLAVMSQGGTSTGGVPVTEPVFAVSVGRRPDHMERRESELQEQYVTNEL